MEFATDIAADAGRVILEHYRTADLAVDHKADDSPVTVADRSAEARLRERIQAAYPADSIVGEEHADVVGTSGRTWYLDPIDGTKSFVHGVPLFTTLIACYDADGPLVGLINAPALDEVTVAGRGAGCFHKGSRCHVTTQDQLDRAYVMTSGTEWWPDALRPLATNPPFTLRTWGDGYGYSLVATGRADAHVDPEAAVWDLAPLPLILAEAGGRFSNLDGRTDQMHGGDRKTLYSAVASNGHLHDDLLGYLAGGVS